MRASVVEPMVVAAAVAAALGVQLTPAVRAERGVDERAAEVLHEVEEVLVLVGLDLLARLPRRAVSEPAGALEAMAILSDGPRMGRGGPH